jgi:hypothetical protein
VSIILILATGCGEGLLGKITQRQNQVIDAAHSRERVVDARRQGATGNLDQLVDEQFKVMSLGSLSSKYRRRTEPAKLLLQLLLLDYIGHRDRL